MPCLPLRLKTFGTDEAIPAYGFAVEDTDCVDHAAAIDVQVSSGQYALQAIAARCTYVPAISSM